MNKATQCRTFATLAAGGTAIVLLALAPVAQDESRLEQDPRQRSQVAEPQEPEFLRQNPAISIEFEGGSVQDYVDVLRRAAPNVNIMLDNDAGDVEVPAFELRGVMLFDALKVLEDLQPEDQSYALSLDHFASGPAEFYAPVFRVTAIPQQRGPSQRPPQPPLQTSVWAISDLIDGGIAAANLLGAIETALSLQEDLGAPEVRFHEETGLILARAHPEQIGVIGEVVHNLRSAITPPKDDNEREVMAMQLEQTRAQLERSMQQENIAARQLRDAIQENERLQARVQILTQELARLRGTNGDEDSGD